MDARIANFERRLSVDPNNRLLVGALSRLVERSGGDGIAVLDRFLGTEDSKLFVFQELAKSQQIPHRIVQKKILFRWFCSLEDALLARGRAPTATKAIKAAGLAAIPGLVMFLNHPRAIVRRQAASILDHVIVCSSKTKVLMNEISGQEYLCRVYDVMGLSIRGKAMTRWVQSFESSVKAGRFGGRAARALSELGRAAVPVMRRYWEANNLTLQFASIGFFEELSPDVQPLPERVYHTAVHSLQRRNPGSNGIYELPQASRLSRRIWQIPVHMGARGAPFYVECYRRANHARWTIRERLSALLRSHSQGRTFLEAYRSDRNAVIRALVRDLL
jgi:hypothetical protein